jgi:hypothetical protein
MPNIDHFLGLPPADDQAKVDWTIPVVLGVTGVALIAAGMSASARKPNPISEDTEIYISRWIRPHIRKLVRVAEKKLGVVTADDMLGCGSYGCVFPLVSEGIGMCPPCRDVICAVMKITCDPDEIDAINIALSLPKSERVGFVNVYTHPRKLPVTGSKWWAYVRESVTEFTEVKDALLNIKLDKAKNNGWTFGISKLGTRREDRFFILSEAIGRYAKSKRRDKYMAAVDTMEIEFPEFSDIAITMRAACRYRDTLLFDIRPFNIGRTASGKMVFFDSEAVHISTRR